MSDRKKLSQIRKKYAEEKLIAKGDNVSLFRVPKLPTGIMSFDMATRGGVPEGRITEFYGSKSSSKSTSALRVVNSYLHKYPEGVPLYADFEQTYDPEWTSNFVTDTSRIEIMQPDYGEQGVEAIIDYANTSECGLIIIDSLAAMVPLGVLKKKIDEDTVGAHPKLVNKLLRHLIPIMSVRKKSGELLTLLIINQTQANIGAYGPAAYVPIKPGGQMKEFMYSMDIRFYVVNVTNIGGVPAKWDYKFSVEKNKTKGGAKVVGTYTMYQSEVDGHKVGDLEELDFIEKAAKVVGTLTREGNKWLSFGKEFRTLDDFQSELQSNPEFLALVKSETLRGWSGVNRGEEKIEGLQQGEGNPDNPGGEEPVP